MEETYGNVLPGMNLSDLVGKLVVIEGTDGVGRSTQINLLKEWLEQQGHAVIETGLSRSGLAGKSIKRAKEGHTLGRITLTLFYATDFADRLDQEILPALRAGFVVLTDRYIYSLIARAMVRDLDPAWIRNVYSFALKPDAIFYLRIGVDKYESFRNYQTKLLQQFDRLAEEYNFNVVDASTDIRTVFEQLRSGILRTLQGEPRPTVGQSTPGPVMIASAADGPAQSSGSSPFASPERPDEGLKV